MKQNVFIKYSKKGVLLKQSANDNVGINNHNEKNSCQTNEPNFDINNHISYQRKDNNDILYPFVIDHSEKNHSFENITQPFIDADKNNDSSQKQESEIPRPRSFDFANIFFNKKRKFGEKTSQSPPILVPTLNKPEETLNKSNTILNQSALISCKKKNKSKKYFSYFYKENNLQETKHVNSEQGLREMKHNFEKVEMKQQQPDSKIIISHTNHTASKLSSYESLSFTTITPKEAAKQYRQNHSSNRNTVRKKKKRRNCMLQAKKKKIQSSEMDKKTIRKIKCKPFQINWKYHTPNNIRDLPELC